MNDRLADRCAAFLGGLVVGLADLLENASSSDRQAIARIHQASIAGELGVASPISAADLAAFIRQEASC